MKRTKKDWDENLMENISTQLKDLRKEYNITQEELSKKSGVSVKVISRIEVQSTNPTIDTFNRLITALTGSDIFKFMTTKKHLPKKDKEKRFKSNKQRIQCIYCKKTSTLNQAINFYEKNYEL